VEHVSCSGSMTSIPGHLAVQGVERGVEIHTE
jgi:hypothetical protein